MDNYGTSMYFYPSSLWISGYILMSTGNWICTSLFHNTRNGEIPSIRYYISHNQWTKNPSYLYPLAIKSSNGKSSNMLFPISMHIFVDFWDFRISHCHAWFREGKRGLSATGHFLLEQVGAAGVGSGWWVERFPECLVLWFCFHCKRCMPTNEQMRWMIPINLT